MAVKQIKRIEVDNPPLTADDVQVRPLDSEEKEEKQMGPVVYGVFFVLIIVGVITGFFLSRGAGSTTASTTPGSSVASGDGKSVGVSDEKTFKDSAVGTIEEGGLDGEGTHRLIRPGGDSQTVYLISSVVDLDQFAGKEVTVWGQTMDAKKAAWLMDVGKVETK
jgi:hypothetical protein